MKIIWIDFFDIRNLSFMVSGDIHGQYSDLLF